MWVSFWGHLPSPDPVPPPCYRVTVSLGTLGLPRRAIRLGFLMAKSKSSRSPRAPEIMGPQGAGPQRLPRGGVRALRGSHRKRAPCAVSMRNSRSTTSGGGGPPTPCSHPGADSSPLPGGLTDKPLPCSQQPRHCCVRGDDGAGS